MFEHLERVPCWQALPGVPGTPISGWPLPGASSLYRRLSTRIPHSHPMTGATVADVLTRLACGAEIVGDGDELAEVCFRAAGRTCGGARDEHLDLAAAVLAVLTGMHGGVRPCGNDDARVHPAPSPAGIRSCTHPAAARTVTR